MITIKYITRAYYGITRVWLDRYTHIPNSYTCNGISCGNTVISIYTADTANNPVTTTNAVTNAPVQQQQQQHQDRSWNNNQGRPRGSKLDSKFLSTPYGSGWSTTQPSAQHCDGRHRDSRGGDTVSSEYYWDSR